MEQDNSVSRLLRALRRAAGLTLEELSERSAVSVRAIGNMERGASRGPQARTVVAVADALGLSADDRDALLAAATAERQRRYEAPSAEALGLPPDAPDFTGRATELAQLRELAAGSEQRVAIISGPGGLGKTALAVHLAGQVADRFPDGRLFLDLRGVDPQPLGPDTALARLLRALGAQDATIPADTEDRTALYRRLMAERRALVVLDNAHSEAQLRPLLPAAGPGMVLITSRRALTGLESGRHVALGPMIATDAVRMLHAVTDGSRQDQDAEQQRAVARLCGHFPLALRIAGNRLQSRPDWTLATLVDRLTAEESRLDRLTAGDLEIRRTFLLSYQQLPRSMRLLFRRLALTAGPYVSAAAAAVVAGMSERHAERLLEELVELGLLVPVGDRYALHDLIRLYARDRLVDEDGTAERTAAAARLRDWLLRTAIHAGATFAPFRAAMPEFDFTGGPTLTWPGLGEAQAWLEAESDGWLAALRSAAAAGLDAQTVAVTEALRPFSNRWLFWGHWHEVFALALDAARRLGDERLEAIGLNRLAWAQLYCLHDPADALTTLAEAARVGRSAGDALQQAWSEHYAVDACLELGDRENVRRHAEAGIGHFRRLPDLEARLPAQMALAALLTVVDRPGEALRRLQQVLDRLDDPDAVSPRHTRSLVLGGMGRACATAGDWAAAVRHYRAAVAAADDADLRSWQGEYAVELAAALENTGRTAEARAAREQAYRLFVETQDGVRAAEARAALDTPSGAQTSRRSPSG